MNDISRYVEYLPPVVWSDDPRDPRYYLGQFLRTFEKVLDGRADGVELPPPRPGAPPGRPVKAVIDDLPRLFDPWKTDAAFLDWLAGWLDAPIPPKCTENQKRALIASIVGIYKERWTKAGLYTYLRLFSNDLAQPRVAVDDGDALRRLTFPPTGAARLDTITFAKPRFGDPPAIGGLLHPVAVAIDPAGWPAKLFEHYVLDAGPLGAGTPSIWRLSATGLALDWKAGLAGEPARPVTVDAADPTPRLRNPAGIATLATGVLAVADNGSPNIATDSVIYLYTRISETPNPAYSRTELLKFNGAVQVIWAVDLVFDGVNRLVILDRGAVPNSGAAVSPKLVVVTLGTLAPPGSPTVKMHPLSQVIEPTALAIEAPDKFLITDAGKQAADVGSAPSQFRRLLAGNVARAQVAPSDPSGTAATMTSLAAVAGVADSDLLIYPTGLVRLASGDLLICDRGLKDPAGTGDPSNRAIAEPARLLRLTLNTGAPPSFVNLTPVNTLVTPGKIAVDPLGGVVVTDRGEAQDIGSLQRDWRALPSEFGVAVYFSQQRPTADTDRTRILAEISRVVNEQKPAHSNWSRQF